MGRQDLAQFLRARRTGSRPEDFGLPTAPRRTPGLRREEVAELAHVSVDYYARLEQARGPHPSPRVLSALADALRLSDAERVHLFRLGAAPGPPTSPKRQVVPSVAAFLNRLPGTAAVVTDAGYDVIAWNPLADALLGDLAGEPNIARRWFLGLGHPMEVSAGLSRVVVARLRAASSRYPADERISGVVAELTGASAEFRELWAADPVHSPGHCDRTVLHPEVGALRLHSDVLAVPDEDQQVVFLTAADTAVSQRLQCLEHVF
ncbi:helix-turn-helix transcriptional regulator [Allokutzneria sp. NRRL B-24872]|uniref:helix-turn-helix transcriptional regulator n=1 Tax=Allokutzneria sp. NRRL B-24872 TaxID=1137961 RepID=UPI000A38777E|nr:helix-turn-helix transcriptional regulator [Allokutzneria sp. NRRL B-24872]